MTLDPVGYVLDLALPQPPPGRPAEPFLESTIAAPTFAEGPQAVAVGSQLAEFGPGVTPAQREAASDCLLLAQLAANKATTPEADVMAWYTTYIEVLQNIGWTVHAMEFKESSARDDQAGVHKAILPVLTAMLGPGAAAASIVISVLDGLKAMDADSPWITLFDRASTHARGAKFQVGSIELDPADGQVKAKLAALAIVASRQITQVLFFKLSAEHARLRVAEGRFVISPQRLAQIHPAVAQRVGPFLLDNIGNIAL